MEEKSDKNDHKRKLPMPSPNTLKMMEDPTLFHIMPSRTTDKNETTSMPPPPPSKKRKAVLDEDSYLDTFGKLIERDYFPHLKVLRLKADYYRALENKEFDYAEELKSILSKIEEDPDEMASLEKGNENDNPDYYILHDVDNNEVKVPKNISLSGFENMVISEDNQSFQDLQQKENEEMKKKLWWLYGNKNDSSLLLSDEEKLLIKDQENSHPMNAFMFPPKLEDSREICQLPRLEDQSKVPKKPKNYKAPVVCPQNTRFPSISVDTVDIDSCIPYMDPSKHLATQTKTSIDKSVIDSPLTTAIQNSLSTSQPSTSISSTDPMTTSTEYTYISTPSVINEGYTPMVQWGEIGSTPQILDNKIDQDEKKKEWWKEREVRLSAPDKREELAQKLYEKMKRVPGSSLGKLKSGNTPLPSPQITAKTPMQTPGVQKLLAQLSSTRKSNILFHQGTSSVLRNSYQSPFVSSQRLPQQSPSITIYKKKSIDRKSTERSTSNEKSKTSQTKTSNITDNLL
ncbi:hypothetical protein WA158_001246 [Blastocystis sp. Blastoise]